jgi:OmcA/MtrC family decaheme c-type cytochrome
VKVSVLRHFAIAAICISACAYLISAPAPRFTQHDKAYYADANLVNFVRPGLVLKITSADIAADGTIKTRFTLTDPKGAPLEREGISTPGPVSVSLIAAYIPKGKTQYVAYTTRSQTSPITNVTAIQAGTDSGGVFEKIADGDYRYTFRTKAPAGFDKSVTHTIGGYATRNLTEFDMGSFYDNNVYNFVPDGSKVTVVRDVIRSATCNKCHTQMAFHGGSRRTMELCVLCHTPQTVDPDTGNTVDMPVMTHKIHMGSSLPSVIAGKKYQIIGNAQSLHDYSDVVFPADARTCSACHEQGATQADNLYKPNRAACGACHDNVNFLTGEGHVDLPQVSDNLCANCHIPRGEVEFDASIIGGHTIPRLSPSLPGVVFELLAVNDGVAGKQPTVTFTLKDKSGKPILPSAMDRLNLVLAGPTSDYATYVSEDARKATGTADGRYFWTFTASIPANAKGSYAVMIEGRRVVTLLQGTKQEVPNVRDAGANKVIFFPVDGSKVEPRRTVVATAKCNGCHSALSFHGDNRNAIEACVICHNPGKTGGPAPGLPISFSVMIHRIHTGSELTIPYSFSASANFNEVGYPGDRRDCAACHVNGSEQLPLSAKLLPVTDPSGPLNPMGPVTAACTGCHTQLFTASHALANTNALGESCAACHGPNSEFSIDRVHAH